VPGSTQDSATLILAAPARPLPHVPVASTNPLHCLLRPCTDTPNLVGLYAGMLHPCSHTGKPGGRKRKIGPIAGNGSMDVVPSSLIMSSGFKPPKVRHLGWQAMQSYPGCWDWKTGYFVEGRIFRRPPAEQLLTLPSCQQATMTCGLTPCAHNTNHHQQHWERSQHWECWVRTANTLYSPHWNNQ